MIQYQKRIILNVQNLQKNNKTNKDNVKLNPTLVALQLII